MNEERIVRRIRQRVFDYDEAKLAKAHRIIARYKAKHEAEWAFEHSRIVGDRLTRLGY